MFTSPDDRDAAKAARAIKAKFEREQTEEKAWNDCVNSALDRSKIAAAAKEQADEAAQFERDKERAARPPRAANWDSRDTAAWEKA
jgi:hypothetical protein